MPRCPRCDTENRVPVNEWVGGPKTSKPMNVQRFVCASCGASFVAWKDSKTGKVRSMARK